MRTVRRRGAARLAAATAAAGCLALLGMAPAGAAATAAGGLAGTTAVPGTLPALVQGATDLGPAPSQPMTVTLALPLRDQAGLAALLGSLDVPSSPSYHRFLTPAQFAAAFGPLPATVDAVTSWAAAQGLTVTSVSPDRDLVGLAGNSAAVGQAFGVQFDSYRLPDGGGTFRSSTVPATVPAAIAGDVSAVVGLSSLGRASLAPVATPTVSFPTSYDPQQLWAHYDAPATRTGAGQTVAVLAAGTLAQPQADLATFEHDFGLPAVPWTTVATGPHSSTTTGDDEWDLDTQYATGMAEDVASLVVYDGSSLTDATVLTETDRWVTDDTAPQANFSAGECEVLADESGFLPAEDEVLQQAVAQGQTLFVASGDSGSFCPVLVGVNGVPGGLPDVDYPASSPYVVSVGGTTILGGPGPLDEIGWYAGGGGQSLLEPEPADQAGVGGSNLGLRRGVPDVAFDADPNSGFDVIVGGQEEVVGGTSGSSPSWLGIWARAQAAHGGDLGFAGDVVYQEPSSSYTDITVGTNGLYPCTPGYDYVTGRGVPDISAFVSSA